MTLTMDRKTIRLAHLLQEAFAGNRKSQLIIKSEAFTTSDMPLLFQKVQNASILKAFTLVKEPLWPKFSQRYVMNSLRPERFRSFLPDLSNLPASVGGVPTIFGGLPHVPELGEYPAIGFTGSEFDVATRKFGARVPFSWEAFQLDDWGVIESLPMALAQVARRTEDLQTMSMVFDTTGWNQTTFPSNAVINGLTNRNYLPGNPVLNLTNLQLALAQARLPPVDTATGNARANTITQWILMVPPELEFYATQMLATSQFRIQNGTTTTIVEGNGVGSSIREIVVNPFIRNFAPTGSYVPTMWGLFPADGLGSDRITLATTFLRGQEVPELRIKDDTGDSYPGGSELDNMAGSFDHDDIQIRVRYFTGGALWDKFGIVLSKGDASALS